FRNEVIYTDDDLCFGCNGALKIVGGFLDFALDEACFNGAQHSTHGVNPGNVINGALFDGIGEVLDGVGAGYRIHGVGDAGFVGEDLLGAEGDEGGVFGGESEGFVEGIGVEGLAAAEDSSEGLNGDTDDI